MDSKQPKGGIFLNTLCAMFFLLWGGFLINNPVMAGDKTVCPSGCDYTSIQMAINAASSEGGGTVFVGTPGRSTAETYYENFGMMSGVDVVSEGDDTAISYTGSEYTTSALRRATLTIIDGGGSDSAVRFPDVDGTLDGFTIQNVSVPDVFVPDVFLVRIGGGSPTIKNNIIHNNTGTGNAGGIGLQGVLGAEVSGTIENNLIHNVHGPGIGNGPSSHAMIRNNKIWDCKGDEGPGIGLLGNTYPTIENNIIFNNSKAGIGSDYSHGGKSGLVAGGGDSGPMAGGGSSTLIIPTIRGNIISNNFAAIRLERASGDTGTINVTIDDNNCTDGHEAGIRLDGLTSATIENNIIKNNGKAGIWLNGLTNATIHNNQIHDQFMAGIRLENIDDVTISENDIHHSHNMAGIRFFPDILQATVDHNQIHENGQAGIRNTGAATLIVQNSNDIFSNSKAGIFIDYAGSTNTIQESNIHDNLFGGIRVASAALVTVRDNNVNGNSYGGINNEGINDLTASGNHINENGYGGINIKSGTGNITQNTIAQNGRGGIAIKAPCTFDITNNAIHDNLRGGIHTGDDSAGGGGYIGAVGDAHLTINKNKVYGNGQTGYGGGIDVRHADGVINNNLVYENHRAGIRFGDYVDQIANNTVVGNGQDGTGAGIVYDDLAGAVNDGFGGYAPDDIPIKNNICTNNEKSGINVKIGNSYACPENRDFNLLCRNHGINTDTCSGPMLFCILRQNGMCKENPDEIFANPLFVDAANDDYHLQESSPAKYAGDDLTDMGAYGGSDPINW